MDNSENQVPSTERAIVKFFRFFINGQVKSNCPNNEGLFAFEMITLLSVWYSIHCLALYPKICNLQKKHIKVTL